MPTTRRTFLAAGIASIGASPLLVSADPPDEDAWSMQIDPELAGRVVGMSHFNLDGVKKELERRPELARAHTDWGFGDYESAIGAASHVGRRPIVEVLLAHGARPTLFTHAMMGHLDVVKATLDATPALARTLGPHGITLMDHARAGREQASAVLEYLKSIEGADEGYPRKPLDNPDALHGTYEPDGVNAPSMIVEGAARADLSLKSEGGVSRNLFHLGDLAFVPAGAGSVRVMFDASSETMTISVAGSKTRFVRS